MKISIYIALSLLASVSIGVMHQPNIRPSEVQLQNLPFTPALNVAVGPQNIVAAYPRTGIDFTMKYHPGTLFIGTESGLRIIDAEVFQVSPTAWTADVGDGQYVTIDAATGEAWAYIDGEFRCYTKETQP